MEPMPFKRSMMTGQIVGNFLYLMGGVPENSRDFASVLAEVWRFNLDSLQEGCEEVSIIEPSENFAIGDEVTIYANVLPSDFANKTIIWSSDNESVVTVLDSIHGILRCENEGTATITAKLKYGGCFDSYTLTVNGPAWKLMNNDARGRVTCVSDSLIFAFSGGEEGWWIGNETWCYNTNTNNWVQLETMPMAMTRGGIGQVGDKIYLVAGYRNESESHYNWITVDSILEYDIAKDTFIFKDKSPLKIGSSISCMMNDTMYLFGGIGSTDPAVDYPYDAMIYDPVNEQWDMASVPDMQYPHLMHGTAEVLNGDIYVLGGCYYETYPNFFIQRSEKFDGEKWDTIADMPVPSVLHTSIVHDNKILLFGGDDFWSPQTSSSTNLIQEYDPLNDSWRLMEPMPFKRSNMGGGKVGNFVYLSGGYLDDRKPETRVFEVQRFNLDSLQEWCKELIINEPSDPLEIGDEVMLTADVLPSDFANKTIIWSSDNESVASVSEAGIITCKDLATATITASLKYGGCSDSYILEVTDITPPGLSIEKDTIDLKNETTVKVSSTEKGYVYLVSENTGKDQIHNNMIQDSLAVEADTWTDLAFDNLEQGTYWLYAIDESYNISEPETLILINSTGNSQRIVENFRIYPNPTRNMLTIETSILGLYNIEITSMNGQIIFSKEFDGTSNQIDLSSFQKGMYLITVRYRDYVRREKIIKL